jgi:sensor histidine kinase YesM
MNKKTMTMRNALKLSLLLSLFWFLMALLGHRGIFAEWTENSINLSYIVGNGIRHIIISTLSFFILFCSQFSIFNKKWKVSKKILVSILVSFIIMSFFMILSWIILYFLDMLSYSPDNVFIFAAFAIAVITITILLTCFLYIVDERAKTIEENQKLLTENMRARYETLKSQINPHFLFNSLNTLNGLIESNNYKAKDFLQQLSLVFRYSIQKKENTTFNDELVFIDAFCILMNIRYGQSLSIKYNIDDKYRSYFVVHLSLQMLVENAIKHNTISNRYPLTITIETTENNTVRVWNRIQPKNEYESGEGIGLANINERYKMLYKKEITISASNEIFSVEIPLIKDGK